MAESFGEVVIVGKDGTHHVFPPGFDPKRAASIVRQRSEKTMLPRETKLGRDGQELPSTKTTLGKADKPDRVKDFITEHYRHFNSSTLKDAAEGYVKLLAGGGEMFVAMAGAMSTAELGRSLAPMIRSKKIHAICCTGANLEEDLFNLIAHDEYKAIPNYLDTTPKDDQKLAEQRINRVTDTGIPEKAAMTPIEECVMRRWEDATRTRAEHSSERRVEGGVPRQSRRQLVARRNGHGDSDLCARVGRFHVRERVRCAMSRGDIRTESHEVRHRIHGRTCDLVPRAFEATRPRILSDRGRSGGGFRDLRCSLAHAGHGEGRHETVGVFLPNH